MNKTILIVLLAFLNIFSENCGDTISLKGNWFIGYKYSYQCSDFKKNIGAFTLQKDFKDIVSKNLNAKKEMNAAISYGAIGTITSCIGGGITGWYLAKLTYGKKADSWVWPTAIGLMGVGITFNIIGTKYMLKSVKIYNKL